MTAQDTPIEQPVERAPAAPGFRPTPEQLASVLDRNVNTIRRMIVEERGKLVSEVLQTRTLDILKQKYGAIDETRLREQIEIVGQALEHNPDLGSEQLTSVLKLLEQDPANAGKILSVVKINMPEAADILSYLERNPETAQKDLDMIVTLLEQKPSIEVIRQLVSLLKEKEAVLKAKDDFMQTTLRKSQEEKAAVTVSQAPMKAKEGEGFWSNAWRTVKSFPAKHPLITAVLVVGVAAAAVAGGFWLFGQWELLLKYVGINKFFAGAGAAEHLLPTTPHTPPLPGGGYFSVPPPAPVPAAPPGMGIVT